MFRSCLFFVCLLSLILGTLTIDKKDDYISTTIMTTHGVHLPRIGFGTAGLRGETDHIVHMALHAGFRMIDSAQAREWYDEARVGKGLRHHLQRMLDTNDVSLQEHNTDKERDNIVIVTKLHPRSFAKHKMQAALSLSKRELYGSDTARPLDVVLLHSPYCWPNHCTKEEERVTWKEGWHNLEQAMNEGHVKTIGISNFDVKELNELIRVSNTKIAVIQNWMDPFHQNKDVRALAKEHGIVYMAYSSFGTQWDGKFDGVNPVFTDDLLADIAEKHGTTISAVVLSWLLQEGVVAIPRSSSVGHIQQNAAPIIEGKDHDGLRVFLDEKDMELIRSLDGVHGTPWD